MTRPTPDKVERIACVGGGYIGAGPMTCYHMGGGKGGVRHMIDHFGWMGDEDAKHQLIAAVDDMYGHLSMEVLEHWRDENLMVMLQGFKPVPGKC